MTRIALALAALLLGAATPGDEAALGALGAAYVDAWNHGDAAGLAARFTEDGDLIIPSGLELRGRPAIESFYAQTFAAGYGGSTARFELAQLRRLDAHLALLDLTFSITGAHDGAGAERPPFRGIAAAVAVKTAAGWRLTALREQAGADAITRMPAPAR